MGQAQLLKSGVLVIQYPIPSVYFVVCAQGVEQDDLPEFGVQLDRKDDSAIIPTGTCHKPIEFAAEFMCT
jgi:hypothetical protein